jgi:hypothetical protein
MCESLFSDCKSRYSKLFIGAGSDSIVIFTGYFGIKIRLQTSINLEISNKTYFNKLTIQKKTFVTQKWSKKNILSPLTSNPSFAFHKEIAK